MTEEERDLDSLIEDREWDRAFERFQAVPDEARRIVNPSLGWTKLHWLCSTGSAPTVLIELVASLYPEAITLPDNRYGDTPLHILCRNSQTSAQKIRILLRYLGDNTEGVLIRNRFGATPLHSASNHNATLEVLQELVRTNPRILRVTTHEGIHAVSALWHSYIQTIPGFMIVARILEGEEVNEGHFDRFWNKAKFLSTAYFRLTPACPQEEGDNNINLNDFVLHGFVQCNVAINLFKVALKRNPLFAGASDAAGNLVLHRILEDRPFRLKEREAIQALLEAAPQAAPQANSVGDFPLLIAIRNKIPWENGVDEILQASRKVISQRDPSTGLYPFQLAAAIGGKVAVDTTFHLLTTKPDLLEQDSERF